MASGGRSSRQFAVCIRNGEHDIDLIVGKLYGVVPPKRHDRPSDVRILDESGEDYLYPRGWFVPVDLSRKARRALVDSVADVDVARSRIRHPQRTASRAK
jgi:hypothetical protein